VNGDEGKAVSVQALNHWAVEATTLGRFAVLDLADLCLDLPHQGLEPMDDHSLGRLQPCTFTSINCLLGQASIPGDAQLNGCLLTLDLLTQYGSIQYVFSCCCH